MESKKTCKMCCEELRTDAIKCPYCHHWQKPLKAMFCNPAFTAILTMLILYSFLGIAFSQFLGPKEQFSNFSDQIHILNSEIRFGETKRGPSVAVIGKLKNNSSVDWEDIHFEVQFFDKDGNLIDTTTKENYSMVIAAEKEQTFKVSALREFPEEQYHSHQVIINYADEVGHF